MPPRDSFTRPTGHIPSLDGMRAFSILIVFFGHIGLSSKIPGGFGVTVFFFLSGFLITELLTREWDKTREIQIKAFYKRRLWRLMPPLLAALGFGYFLLLAGLTQGRFEWTTLAAQLLYFQNYLLVATGDPDAGPRGLTILWSLAVEEHFYLIYPLLFVLVGKRIVKLGHLLALAAAILVWRIYLFGAGGEDMYWALYSRTDTRFDAILYGCILSIMCWRGLLDAQWIKRRKTMLVALAVSLMVLAFCFLHRDAAFRSTWRYSLQGIALMPLFFYAVYKPRFFAFRPLNWAPVKAMGVYSYNFYLGHYVIISSFEYLNVFENSFALFITMTFLANLIYAMIIYHLIEKPIRAARNRKTVQITNETVHVRSTHKTNDFGLAMHAYRVARR